MLEVDFFFLQERNVFVLIVVLLRLCELSVGVRYDYGAAALSAELRNTAVRFKSLKNVNNLHRMPFFLTSELTGFLIFNLPPSANDTATILKETHIAVK